MSLARASSGGVAIRYLLPVLWMTSYLHIMAVYMGAGVTLEQPQPASQPNGAGRRLGLARPWAVAEAASRKPVTL